MYKDTIENFSKDAQKACGTEEERRRLENFKAEIAEMVNGEAAEIERRKNAANVEIAKIANKVYRDLKGGNQ